MFLNRLLIPVCIFILSLMFRCQDPTGKVDVPDNVDFNFDVRPILVQNCYLCHGPDPSSRKANLRLDTFEGATALLDEGRKAIVPGSPGRSELMKRILHQDPDQVMPPPESNLVLSEYDIEVLKKWIDQGAEWKPHWAFIQPKITQPQTFRKELSENKIDDYVLEKIADKNLEVAQQADRNTLIRRVSFILTGLPPSPEKLGEFLSDRSPDAYEKMVNYYLQSPAFGERWARHWMDLVRYAESKGHEFDYEITDAWRYRDYLIRAFNNDVPYDMFVKEHLAGDLMDSVRWNPDNGINESHIGTAFYALGEGTHSPVDIKKDEADRIDNMIDVTTKMFQGLTVSCARCHDHKFDPIPTSDYYALYGVMQSSRFSPRPAEITFEKVQNHEKLLEIKSDIQEIIANAWSKDKNILNQDTERSFSNSGYDSKFDYELLGDFRCQSLDGWRSDGLAFGNTTTLGNPVFSNKKLVRLKEGMASSRIFSTGIYGALRSQNFTISEDFIGIRARGQGSTIRIIIDNFQLISNPIYGGLDIQVNDEDWKNYQVDVSKWIGHKAYIEILPGSSQGQQDRHVYHLSQNAYIESKYAIAFSDSWPDEVELKEDDSMSGLAKEYAPGHLEKINHLITSGKLESDFPELESLLVQNKQLSRSLTDSTFFMGIEDGDGINSHVFVRGNHTNLSEEPVQRGFLSAITSNENAFTSSGSGRIEMVEAMFEKENPLTARVMVNRIWHHLFGRGLVETVDNFGLQGKLPTHPELLDYLAIKFQQDGWSMKSMIKYIVMSKTFRRNVNAMGIADQVDPDNHFLSHFPLRRLESEAIRDGLLAVSGMLDLSMYGEPIPVHLTDFMQGRGRPESSGPLNGAGRRSIYQEVRRNFLEPMMITFDRPIPFTTFGRRNVTNVPAQSLIMMNDEFVILQAEILAKRLLDDKKSSQEQRIEEIYIRALSRKPNEEELLKAIDYIRFLAQSYNLSDEAVAESLDVWKDYCHSVFNLKEFIYLI